METMNIINFILCFLEGYDLRFRKISETFLRTKKFSMFFIINYFFYHLHNLILNLMFKPIKLDIGRHYLMVGDKKYKKIPSFQCIATWVIQLPSLR